MRLQQDSLTNIKNYIHAAQAFVVLVAWILTIAIYVANGSTDGRTSWFFALVSTLPAPPNIRKRQLTSSLVLAHRPNAHLPRHDTYVVPHRTLRQRVRFRNPRRPLCYP